MLGSWLTIIYLVAGAVVGPNSVPADVLAAPVVGGALVLVREEDGGEAILLDGVVREKLQPETVALGCNNLAVSGW